MEETTQKKYTVNDLAEAIKQNQDLFEDYLEHVWSIEVMPADFEEWLKVPTDQRRQFNAFVNCKYLYKTYDEFKKSYCGYFGSRKEFVEKLVNEGTLNAEQLCEIKTVGHVKFWESKLQNKYIVCDDFYFLKKRAGV